MRHQNLAIDLLAEVKRINSSLVLNKKTFDHHGYWLVNDDARKTMLNHRDCFVFLDVKFSTNEMSLFGFPVKTTGEQSAPPVVFVTYDQ